MIKSFKVMLVPNNKQRTRLFQFAGTARFAYNWALNKEMTAFENGENFISIGTLRKEFTLIRNSVKYSWLSTISNNVTKQAIKDLGVAYKNFFDKQQNTKIKYTKEKLKYLARIGKSPTVYDMNGHPKFKSNHKNDFNFYQDHCNISEKEKILEDDIRINLGLKNLAICSDGTVYLNINKTKLIKKLNKRERRLQRSISRKYYDEWKGR